MNQFKGLMTKRDIKSFSYLLSMFIFIIIIGYVFALTNKTLAIEWTNKVASKIMHVSNHKHSTFSGIFLNNIKASLFVIIGGLVTVYIYPILALLMNGAMTGLVIGTTQVLHGGHDALVSFLAGYLPHAIFEVPETVIACVIGIKIGRVIYRSLFKKPDDETRSKRMSQHFKSIFLLFLYIVLPLTFIAGLIEAFITPHLLRVFL